MYEQHKAATVLNQLAEKSLSFFIKTKQNKKDLFFFSSKKGKKVYSKEPPILQATDSRKHISRFL